MLASPRQFLLASIGTVILILILVSTQDYFQPTGNTRPTSLTDNRPSIVVLPFTNLSKKTEQNYFSDGVTVDITTALSKLSGLFVISPNSAKRYDSKPLDTQRVADSLGVRYILEGSIRRIGNKLRVNVHLIDAISDIYLWSEKYDRELSSVFEVQDDITANIVAALAIKLTEEEKKRASRKLTTSIAAYDDFLRGQVHYSRRTQEDNQIARDYYQRAIDRDTTFARAYSAMAMTHATEHRYGWRSSDTEHLYRALELARHGVSLDNELPQAHWVLGYVHLFRREYDKAARSAQHAIALDPNYADSYLTLAVCKIHEGAPEKSLPLIRKAMLLNPEYPTPYTSVLGQAYYYMGQYQQAASVLREALERNTNLLTAHVYLIASLSKLNRLEEANWAAEQLKATIPSFTVNQLPDMIPAYNHQAIKDVSKQLLRAGL